MFRKTAVWYNLLTCQRYKQSSTYKPANTFGMSTNYTKPTLTYNRLPDDEPSGSKHVEDNKN